MGDHLSQEEIDRLLGKASDESDESQESQEDSSQTQSEELEKEEFEESAEGIEGLRVRKAKFKPLRAGGKKKANRNVENFGDVVLKLSVELGKTTMTIRDVLTMKKDSVIELEKLAGDDVNVLVNNQFFAQGEIVIINDSFGLRIISF